LHVPPKQSISGANVCALRPRVRECPVLDRDDQVEIAQVVGRSGCKGTDQDRRRVTGQPLRATNGLEHDRPLAPRFDAHGSTVTTTGPMPDEAYAAIG
jgi:hypothetical protein